MTTVALTFINENGKKYRVLTDKVREGATLEMFGELLEEITHIGASDPTGENHWVRAAPPKFVEDRPAKKSTSRKKDKEPRKAPTKPRTPPKKNWVVSPPQILNGKPSTVIQKLKNFFQGSGDPEVFVSSLWLVKTLWHSRALTLTQRIDRRDFYFEMKAIFDLGNKWTARMLEALPQLSFIFSKEEWARLRKQWKARRSALKKEMKELKEDEEQQAETTADDILRQIEAELREAPPESVIQENPPTKSRPSKAKRDKLKKYNQKGVSGKKKESCIFWPQKKKPLPE